MEARATAVDEVAVPERRPALAAGGSLLALALLLGGCDAGPSGPEGPGDVLSVRRETASGVYRYAPGDTVDLEVQQAYYAWLFDRMGVEPAAPLVFLKYRNRAHMERLTGKLVNGWAELGTYRFHTIWSFDNHEAVHALVSSEWSAAPALMNEGFAVAHQVVPGRGILEPVWNGSPIDTIAARALRSGTVPPLGELVGSRDFRRYEESLTYPLAGSFVRSVLRRHGYRAAEAFFLSSDIDDSGSRLRANFRAAFGEEIEDAWSVWLDALR